MSTMMAGAGQSARNGLHAQFLATARNAFQLTAAKAAAGSDEASTANTTVELR